MVLAPTLPTCYLQQLTQWFTRSPHDEDFCFDARTIAPVISLAEKKAEKPVTRFSTSGK